MAEAAAVVRSFPVGKRICTLTIQAPRLGGLTNIVAEWSPTVPRRLTKKELRQYRAGRDAAALDLAKLMPDEGPHTGSVLMIEV